MDLRTLTGLTLSSLADAEQYYHTHTEQIPDCPDFSDEVLPWLRYLDNARPGETWSALTGRLRAEKDAAIRGGDIFRAIYPDEPTDASRMFEVADAEQDAVDALLVHAAGLWSEINTDAAVGEVFGALIDLSPMWARISLDHAPDSAEWIWSRMRMVCGSAGYNHHAMLTEKLVGLYPQCPMLSSETKEEWLDHLIEAHKACGWPVQLGQLEWRELVRVIQQTDDGGFHHWHLPVALLHILKHVRLGSDPPISFCVMYRGHVLTAQWPKGTNTLTPLIISSLVGALGLPVPATKKLSHQLGTAARHVLARLSTNNYLRQKPLSHLPGLVLHGPWSSLVQDPTTMDGFICHGLRLSGVWLASDGKVEPVNGTTADIVGFAWNHTDALAPERLDARVLLERIIPATYSPGFASDLFAKAFPNLSMPEGVDADAAWALFDAPIVASLLRAEVPSLLYEYPIVAFLPLSPTLDESTNQGKSMAALTYARILAPTIDHVSSGLDSGSAPDTRDVADQLRTHGTMALDEFQVPKSKNHPLSRSNLQLLCTGGRVSSGKVLENSGGVSLRHSIVVNAKALDFNPDMTNRTLPFYLSDLTDEHRSNAVTLEAVQSGRLALLARLQTLAMVVENGVTAELMDVAKVSTAGGLRFGAHRAIARILFRLRTGREDAGEVDQASEAARSRFQAHQHDADDSGVLASLDEGTVTRMRLSSLLGDLQASEVEAVAGHLAYHGSGDGWGPVSALINGRATVAGFSGKPLCDAMGAIFGKRLRMSNRSVVLAVEREIRQAIQPDAKLKITNSGWFIYRRDTPEGMLVKMSKAVMASAAP